MATVNELVVLTKVPVSTALAIVWLKPPVKPLPVGTNQLYVVPAGTMPLVTLVGDVLNTIPPHAAIDIAVTTAVGFTVTVNTNDAFTPQLTEVGVTVYVALWAILVGLVSVPLRFTEPAPLPPPVIPPVTIGADQLYVVPNGTIPLVPLVGVEVNNTPLHVTALIDVMAATGLTVTVNWNEAPAQLPVVGVTV